MKDYTAITLKAGVCELELVPEFGGLTNKLILGVPGGGPPLSLIAGLANRHEMETDQGYHGIPLFPVVNRLDKGKYKHNGQEYQLEANESALNNTLHGFIQHLQPTVTLLEESHEQARACLEYDYDGDIIGYPFPVLIKITYTLKSKGALHIQFEVINNHCDSIPVGIGWHPYFQLGETVDTLSLRLPLVKHTPVNERMLPTGDKTEFTKFSSLSKIGSKRLDDCFEIQKKGDISTLTLWSEEKSQGFDLWQQTGSKAYNFIQICIPPDRQSIAIEPVSCGINAFNTQDGLIDLPRGASFSAECGVNYIENNQV